MKSNFLKNSLAAFAFSLAIVASFAFSPAEGDVSLIGYQFESTLNPCVSIGDVSDDCVIVADGPVCLIDSKIVYKDWSTLGTKCTIELKKKP